MSKPETITIDEVKYVRADSIKTPVKIEGDTKIVILQRGNVMVGTLIRDEIDRDMCQLIDCAVIRAWGTTKGLGEIASGGPTNKTILDKCPDVTFHILTTIAIMSADGAKWQKHL